MLHITIMLRWFGFTIPVMISALVYGDYLHWSAPWNDDYVRLTFLFYSPPVLGHSPDQYSTRWQCCRGKGVCDDMYSDSGERVDSTSECHLDWSRRKPHWCGEYHCGTCTDLWPCNQPVTDTILPAVTRGREVFLQSSYQCTTTWAASNKISIQTTGCDKYVSCIFTTSHPTFYEVIHCIYIT